jgi:uncharacterized protein YqgC (DUF456 family)
MDSRYARLGLITAILALVGLLARYFAPIHEAYRTPIFLGFLLVGFIVFGYGYGDGWKWPVWLGTALVLIAFILLGNLSILWFVLALGLGTISYSWHAQTHTHH